MTTHQDSTSADQLLDLALQHHQRGELEQAERFYRQVLEREPNNGDAHHLLGVLAYQAGQYDVAVKRIGTAIRINRSAPMYHNNFGLALQGSAELDKAAESFRSALALDSHFAEAYSNLGNVLRLQGKHDEAGNAYRQALSLQPQLIDAHLGLGKNFGAQDRFDDARHCFEHALTVHPYSAEAHNCLGLLFDAQNQLTPALQHLQRALELNPRFAEAHNNIGNMLMKLGRTQEAVNRYRHALTLAPTHTDIQLNLGKALKELGQLDEALGLYGEALQRDPKSARAHQLIGIALQEQGYTDEALCSYRRALALQTNGGLKTRIATLLPVIPQSSGDISVWRERFATGIEQLQRENISLKDPLAEVNSTNFYLSYHGLDNRGLQTQVARMYEQACPSLLWTAPHCREWKKRSAKKIRVGFISSFMREHSIGKTTRGLFAHLSPDRFEKYALFVSSAAEDSVGTFMRQHADGHLLLPNSLPVAREAIADLRLDILFYQDIGMEPLTYFLAFSRLAPVQCVSFGHPETTGIGNMDYFVSNDLFEPENGAEHYSEKLFLLRNLGTLAYYYRPTLPTPLKDRAAFGLPAEGHLYVCPQTLFKFHPDFDELLAGILRADRDAVLVAIQSRIPQWTEMLKARWRRAMPEAMNRIIFVPQQNSADFLNLLALADVVLDTPHFNGMNSSLEAFSVDTPIVTLPMQFQRSRHTAGMYRKMGLSECVAHTPEQYIELAVRLGTDTNYRNAIKKEIQQRSDILFEDTRVVEEFERFFVAAVERADRPLA